MKKLDLNNVDLQKEALRDKIVSVLESNCSNDPTTCNINSCKFYDYCFKGKLLPDGLPAKRRPLKSLLVSLRNQVRKNNGSWKRSPHNSGNTLMERIEYCLGQNIYEHELINGCEWAKVAISRCTTLSQVVEILDRRHVHQYGKSKLWHYNTPK